MKNLNCSATPIKPYGYVNLSQHPVPVPDIVGKFAPSVARVFMLFEDPVTVPWIFPGGTISNWSTEALF
jgi:hypothetical protein